MLQRAGERLLDLNADGSLLVVGQSVVLPGWEGELGLRPKKQFVATKLRHYRAACAAVSRQARRGAVEGEYNRLVHLPVEFELRAAAEILAGSLIADAGEFAGEGECHC